MLKELNLLNESRGFKFVIIMVLRFKEIIKEDETKYSTFYLNSKAEMMFTMQTLIMCLN